MNALQRLKEANRKKAEELAQSAATPELSETLTDEQLYDQLCSFRRMRSSWTFDQIADHFSKRGLATRERVIKNCEALNRETAQKNRHYRAVREQAIREVAQELRDCPIFQGVIKSLKRR